MGTTSKSKKGQPDTRPLNIQPNEMPAAVTATVLIDGEQQFTLDIDQADKRSEKGNVGYKAEIQGWVLEGNHVDTLKAITVLVNGVQLKMSDAGVHDSQHENPTTFRSATIVLPVNGGEPRRYVAKSYVTFSVAKKTPTYSLTVTVYAAPTSSQGERPGHVTGARINGSIVLHQPAAKAA